MVYTLVYEARKSQSNFVRWEESANQQVVNRLSRVTGGSRRGASRGPQRKGQELLSIGIPAENFLFFDYCRMVKLLEQFASLGGNEEPTCTAPDPALVRKRNTTARLKARAEYRTRLMIEDVKKRVDETGLSSDEEVPDEPSTSKIPLTAAGRSTLYSPIFVDLDLHQPIYMNDVKDMLKEYQRLKELEPDSPSLDITEIAVEDVYERAGLACIAEKNLPAEISEAMKQPLKPAK
ncbi:hypothetical protein Tcan_17370 [Toxocara canis]|uniref:Uncharacterized protein n=1 Tax=Toxocara canis TaxID=6265 RepID=A0A0B2UP33_TOXCA|nr:hypothetical protein Tcan_17370 [Toxocara canis]